MYNLHRQVSTCTVQCLLLMHYELCTNKFLVLIQFQNYQNQGQSTEGKEKKEEDRNDDKKMKQIRIFLYQLYPIYIIKNNKLLKKQ